MIRRVQRGWTQAMRVTSEKGAQKVNIRITGRHLDVTDAIREYVEKKIGRLERYYNKLLELEVTLDGEGSQLKKVEILAKPANHELFVVHEEAEDLYACFDAALDKMERRLSRWKEKSRDDRKHRTSVGEASHDLVERGLSEGASEAGVGDSGEEEQA